MGCEIFIAGDGCALKLNVVGYEFAHAADYHDANWLVTDAELATSESRERFRITVLSTELLDFRDRLRRAIELGKGFPTLDHLEEQVGCTIAIEGDAVEMSAFLRQHDGPELSVSSCKMGKDHLDQALHGLDNAVESFPVRDRPE